MIENRRKPGYVIGIRILKPYFEYLKAIKKYKKDWSVEDLADDLVKLMYDYGNPYSGYGLYYTDRTKLYEEEPSLETYDLVTNVEEYNTVRKAKTVIDRHYGDMLQVDLVKLPETKAPAKRGK